ncbi:MAG: TetR/AcrR family transcriptional regulator [Dysgonamonadaceae bacterium]|jgi:AcrR family transcriptional regulator|nr:TetR/AcrR family transcriptional regulator [Dysgonamonadaceae bacterium]
MDIKDRIIQESTPLFLKNGVRSMTMSDIANELGISKRTLYEVFRDKEELLEECFKWNFDQGDKEIEGLIQSSENVIDALMRMYAQHLRSTQDFNRSLVHDLKKYYAPIYKKIEARKENAFKAFIPLMIKGVDSGFIRRDTNFEIVVWLVRAQFKSLIDEEYIPTDKYSVNEFISVIILNFIRGIATPLGNAEIEKMVEKIKQKQY